MLLNADRYYVVAGKVYERSPPLPLTGPDRDLDVDLDHDVVHETSPWSGTHSTALGLGVALLAATTLLTSAIILRRRRDESGAKAEETRKAAGGEQSPPVKATLKNLAMQMQAQGQSTPHSQKVVACATALKDALRAGAASPHHLGAIDGLVRELAREPAVVDLARVHQASVLLLDLMHDDDASQARAARALLLESASCVDDAILARVRNVEARVYAVGDWGLEVFTAAVAALERAPTHVSIGGPTFVRVLQLASERENELDAGHLDLIKSLEALSRAMQARARVRAFMVTARDHPRAGDARDIAVALLVELTLLPDPVLERPLPVPAATARQTTYVMRALVPSHPAPELAAVAVGALGAILPYPEPLCETIAPRVLAAVRAVHTRQGNGASEEGMDEIQDCSEARVGSMPSGLRRLIASSPSVESLAHVCLTVRDRVVQETNDLASVHVWCDGLSVAKSGNDDAQEANGSAVHLFLWSPTGWLLVLASDSVFVGHTWSAIHTAYA